MDAYPWLQFTAQNRGVLFWQLQAIGWSATVPVAVLSAANYNLSPEIGLAIGLFRMLFALGVTGLLLRPALRGVRSGQYRMVPTCLILLVASAAISLAEMFATRELVRLVVPTVETASVFLVTSTAMRIILYVFWSLMYFGINYWLDTQDTHLRLARLEAETRTAELRQLREQVNPHFLFNALNSIQAEAGTRKNVLALTQGLAEYLRFSLHHAEDGQALGKELDAIEHYLRVEGIRFEDRFQYSIEADEQGRRCRVPGALVQPLVENAVKFGQRTSPPPLKIAVRVAVDEESLMVEVANSGQWVDPDPNREGGIGLSNLRRRLDLTFDGRARVDVIKGDEQVRVVLRLPAEGVRG